MKTLLLAGAMALAATPAALAGPAEEAQHVVDQFKAAFESADVEGVVRLFARDATFLGTISPKFITETDDVAAYFQGLRTNTPRTFTIDTQATVVLAPDAVLIAGLDTFSQTKDGQVALTPARFTFVIAHEAEGWRIKHFHSSMRPKPQ
jgi:uncharacterized protein (TIGR02246 family)